MSKNDGLEWTFDVGNSTRGPIGFVARVNAATRKVAVEKLKAAMPEYVEVENDEGVQLTVFFNPDYAFRRSGTPE